MTRQPRRLFLLAVLLGGCTLLLDESTAPEVREVIVATSVEVTYARAQRAAAHMGGTLLAQAPADHTFTVQVKKVVALHIDVRRVAEGTQMTVTGTILPKQMALGILTEVDEFLRAYRKEEI
jgi:hypothetical protein